uniref:(northern house mosquito) hypothetical protein n=1 Tax=Culex pipiens TaxID=7175 RepID=A0A8D8PG80_CULPI
MKVRKKTRRMTTQVTIPRMKTRRSRWFLRRSPKNIKSNRLRMNPLHRIKVPIRMIYRTRNVLRNVNVEIRIPDCQSSTITSVTSARASRRVRRRHCWNT